MSILRSLSRISISIRSSITGETVTRGEAGMAAGVAVERRDAHQPMHPGLGLEPAIGVLAADLDRRRLDAGLLALALLDPLDLVAVLLGPAQVHAQQHLGPVLAFGAAGAGIHLQERVVAVGLARQQRFELQPLDLLLASARDRAGPRRRWPRRPRPRRARPAPTHRPAPAPARAGARPRRPAGCARA